MNLSMFIELAKEKLDVLYDPVKMVFEIIIIIIVSAILLRAGSYLIHKLFKKQRTFKYGLDEKRIATLSSLFVSIYRYAIYIMAGVAILAKLTNIFNLQSVMTAAGIGGVAIGFGAQSLIKDIISGFFIIMENQYAVGELVSIDNMTGTVEDMELRVTKMRSFNGDLYVIPNGEIKKITNHVRGNKAVIVDIPVAYSANADMVLKLAGKVCETVAKEFDTIVEKPSVLGITDMTKENMTLRIFAKTLPNEQWAVERRIRKIIKDEFDIAGIEFYDKQRIVQKVEDGKGETLNG